MASRSSKGAVKGRATRTSPRNLQVNSDVTVSSKTISSKTVSSKTSGDTVKGTNKRTVRATNKRSGKRSSNEDDKGCDIVAKKPAKAVKFSKSVTTIPSPTVDLVTLNQGVRLSALDYQKSCEDLCRYLLGKRLVSQQSDGAGGMCRVSGRIVETEAYIGGEDKASHSYNGKRTERTEAMYMDPGTVYVYNIYGVMCCVNVSSQGDGAAVLIRSLEPVEGLDEMRRLRGANIKSSTELTLHKLCNGPSKLTQALGITKANSNKLDLLTSNQLWIESNPADPGVDASSMITCSRIGLGKSAEEWALTPLRFYVRDCKSVSVRDKNSE